MVISIGEILLDVISKEEDSSLEMKGKLGGAPFNVAANISLIEGESKFYGVVGKDSIGEHIENEAKKYPLKKILLEKDKERSTTLALVSLTNGERSFSFMRGADYLFSSNSLDKLNISIGDIIHLGSLMLSKEEGRVFFDECLKYAKRKGAYISFDANLRLDIFKNEDEARRIYKNIFSKVDVLKLSEDELTFFGYDDPKDFYNRNMKKNSLLFVTYGPKGSALISSNNNIFVPSEPITVIDSTGAGDAFFARVLKELDELKLSLNFNRIDFYHILELANKDGAKACTHYGALQ